MGFPNSLGDFSGNCLSFVNEVPYILVTLTNNKAIVIIVSSLPSSGFCVNDGINWTNYGYSCDRSQARFSNSHNSGLPPVATTKSKGGPSWTSDASSIDSWMSGGAATSNQNPLKTINYRENLKWGNPTATKWTGTGKPDTAESSSGYEGEFQRK